VRLVKSRCNIEGEQENYFMKRALRQENAYIPQR
jgi:hypothetical protein